MDIIIFSGQSNMQGQSDCLSDSSVVTGAYEYKWMDHCLVPLQNPVGENIKYDKSKGDPVLPDTVASKWLEEHVLGAASYGHTNMVPKFCEAYLQNKQEVLQASDGADMLAGTEINKIPAKEAVLAEHGQSDQQVIAVHAAKGSTKIEEWLPGTEGYKFLTGKALGAIQYARKTGAVIEHIFFVWLQGESDAIAGISKAVYKERMTCLKDALKKDLQINRFGVIRVGRFTEDERDWEIIRAQSEICKEDSDFLMLTEIATELNTKQQYMHPGIHGHYSALGLETLGEAAGKTLARYAAENEWKL